MTERMLKKDPVDRPQNIATVLKSLEKLGPKLAPSFQEEVTDELPEYPTVSTLKGKKVRLKFKNLVLSFIFLGFGIYFLTGHSSCVAQAYSHSVLRNQ